MDPVPDSGLHTETVNWLVVGTIGIGQPVVDRWDMYGDGPSDDPYSLDWAPTPRR